MPDNLKRFLNNGTVKTLLGNFTYLSILEVVAVLFPLITYPYLIRVIGAEKYGIIVFAQAIIAYVIIVVNFGFNVSATRRVSENRNDVERLREIYSSITYLKLTIFIISLLVLLVILFLFKFNHEIVIWMFMGLCIQEVFFPTWFFQGVEKMQFITIVTFLSRFTFLLLIFLVVHTPSDYLLVPLLYSLGGVITTIASLVILKKHFDVYLIKIPIKQMILDIKESLPFFASRLSSVVMERTNVIVLGSFFTYEMVAIYDLCSKVVSMMTTPFQLVAQVIYPNVAKSKNMNIVSKAIKPVLSLGVLFSLAVCLLSYYIVLLLGGEDMLESVPLLRMMVWYVPLVGMSSLFGASTLVVNNHSAEYNKSVVYSLFVYLTIIGILILLDIVNFYTMVLAYLIPEIFLVAYRIYITKKFKLLKV